MKDILAQGGYDYDMLFGEAVRKTETFDDDIYGIPYAVNRFAIMYNKSIFDKAGVPYPTDDWTWDEYREIAKKVSSGEGANRVYGCGDNPLDNPAWSLLAELELGADCLYKNATESNWDHPAFLKSLDFFYSLFRDGSIMPDSEVKARQISGLGGRFQHFLKGGSAMMIATSYLVFQQNYPDNKKDFEVGYVNMPRLSKGTPLSTTIDHSALSISSATKDPDGALKFIMFYSVDRPDIGAAAKGMMPPNALTGNYPSVELEKICYEKMFTAPGVDFTQAMNTFTREDEKIIPSIYFNSYNVALNEIKTVALEETTRVFNGEQDTRTAIANMKRRSDEQIARVR
jgi:multiple sugar transport system substrate-binding protein